MKHNDNYRICDKNFSVENFSSPENSYSPFYSWIWNAPVTKEETDRQLDEFMRLGIKAFYIIAEPKTFRPTSIPTMLEPDYLTEPYYEAYAYALKSAFSRGMIAWIYDEGGWPSGGACGRVLLKHPELARRGLGQRKLIFKQGEKYSPSEDSAAAFLPDGKMIEAGFVFSEDTEISEYFSQRFFFKQPGIPDFPDLTLPQSTEAFIEETFPGYEQRLSGYFGNEITAVFSDEPEAPRPVPFRKELEEKYEKRWGESIRPHLDVLWKNIERLWVDYDDVTVPKDSAQAIIRWYDLCSEAFCENYLLREKKWCNDRGLSFVGHLNGDDLPMGSVRSASYHLLRALRSFDIPAVDVIWRQIFPNDKQLIDGEVTAENRFFPRYASSAAAQIGSDLSATESFGVYGQSLTYDEMRYTVGFQAIRGINIFNYMLKNYGRSGFFMTGGRPDFSEELRNSADVRTFNEYTERLTYLTSLGDRDVNVALYFPMCDVWSGANTKTVCEGYEQAGYELEEDGIYFDILDDDVLDACDSDALCRGVISMGKADCNTVIVPPTKYIPQKSVERLEKFVAAGGRVIVIKSDLTPEISGAELMENCRGALIPAVALDFSSKNLRTYSKTLENGRLDLVFNQGFDKEEVTLFVSNKAPVLVDITSGKLRKLTINGGKALFELASGETVGLLYTDEAFELVDDGHSYEIALGGEYLFRKCEQFVLGETEVVHKSFDEAPTPMHLGDWRGLVGESFYGTGIYSIEFDRPENMGEKLTLDLGKVNYTAEVYINGERIGNLIMPPYSLTLPADILCDKNILEIRVTNSAANEYKFTKTFDKFAKWQLSPYHDKQMAFCESNLEGGLFGPVKIFF
ncbi:MAG: hypothetical protein J6B48_10135 [Clostridia bacterium]|nr:hypothetical protein [Clostridia bacterium]